MNLLSGITGKSVIFVFLGDVSDSRHLCVQGLLSRRPADT